MVHYGVIFSIFNSFSMRKEKLLNKLNKNSKMCCKRYFHGIGLNDLNITLKVM